MLGTQNLLAVKDAAKQLGCCERTLRQWVADGAITFVRQGRSIRFSEADIQRFIKKNKIIGIGESPEEPQRDYVDDDFYRQAITSAGYIATLDLIDAVRSWHLKNALDSTTINPIFLRLNQK